MSRETFSRKRKFWNEKFFQGSFWTWTENCRPVRKLFSMVVKCELHICIGSCLRELIMFIVYYSSLFADFGGKNSTLPQKIVAGPLKLHSTCSEEQFEKTGFFEEKPSWDFSEIQRTFLHFFTFLKITFLQQTVAQWAKENRKSSKNFLAGYSKLHFTCPKKHFDGKENFDTFFSILTLSDILNAFSEKKSTRT